MDEKVAAKNIISLITDGLKTLLHSSSISDINSAQILGSIFDMFFFYDRPFLHVFNLWENLLFFTLILGSLFSNHVDFYGDNSFAAAISVTKYSME